MFDSKVPLAKTITYNKRTNVSLRTFTVEIVENTILNSTYLTNNDYADNTRGGCVI